MAQLLKAELYKLCLLYTSIILNIPQKVTFCAGNFWKYAGLRNFLIFHEDDRQFPVGHTMIYLLS